VIFLVLFYSNEQIQNNLKRMLMDSKKILKLVNPINLFNNYEFDRTKMPDHVDEWESFYDTWHMNKFIGGGVRSFRINCPQRKNIHKEERSTCNTHPHNYYLEILTDLGLVGFIIFSIIVVRILLSYFFIKISSEKESINSKILVPFFMLFFAEIFPIKSSGSFFNSTNATCIFIFLAITIALINNKKT